MSMYTKCNSHIIFSISDLVKTFEIYANRKLFYFKKIEFSFGIKITYIFKYNNFLYVYNWVCISVIIMSTF